MAKVVFGGNAYQLEQQETVLVGLERQGVNLPNSCRSGVCQSCLIKAVSGEIPAAAQVGLKTTLQKQAYFMACLCKPVNDIEIALPGEDVKQHFMAKVLEKTPLSEDVFRLRLSRDKDFNYYPGQFIVVHRDDELMRSYSLASLPSDDFLELHIQQLANGRMSSWLRNQLQLGDEIKIDAAVGSCFYVEDDLDKNLLLIGTGTGLSPLWGIIRDALSKGHKGDIYLYHGSHSEKGIYLQDPIRALADQHENFHYIPSISGETHREEYRQGRANDLALKAHNDLKNWKVYLCGHPDMVASTKKKAFLAGASISDIYSDPFIIATN